MKRLRGFTLIELLIFIIVSSLLLTVIFIGGRNVLIMAPRSHNQWVAIQTANRCMEWFINQRRINGYTSIACATSTPSACTVPTGFSLSTTVTCAFDGNSKTIQVNVTGLMSVSISAIIGNY